MSKNNSREKHPYGSNSESVYRDATSNKNKAGYIVGLVPSRNKNCSEKVYQQLMEEYVVQLHRLEIIKKLEDCMKGRG